MVSQKEAMRRFVREAMRVSGLDLSNLAREAGVVESTLTRFMNRDVKHDLSLRTLQKVSAFADLPIPEEVLLSGPRLQPADDREKLVAEQLLLLKRAWRLLTFDERAAILAAVDALAAPRRKAV